MIKNDLKIPVITIWFGFLIQTLTILMADLAQSTG